MNPIFSMNDSEQSVSEDDNLSSDKDEETNNRYFQSFIQPDSDAKITEPDNKMFEINDFDIEKGFYNLKLDIEESQMK